MNPEVKGVAVQLNPLQLNCFALNQHYSLEGVNGPNIYALHNVLRVLLHSWEDLLMALVSADHVRKLEEQKADAERQVKLLTRQSKVRQPAALCTATAV